MEFIKFINQYQGFFYVIFTFANVCIFGLILWVTIKYANSTKIISDKAADSVKATEKHIRVINDLEKDKLTFKLIKEWLTDKKFLTFNRKESGLELDYKDPLRKLKGFGLVTGENFLDSFNSFLDYFSVVYYLLKCDRINKDFYFKILTKDIVSFRENEYEENSTIANKARKEIEVILNTKLPIVSNFDGLRNIYEIANTEFKDYWK